MSTAGPGLAYANADLDLLFDLLNVTRANRIEVNGPIALANTMPVLELPLAELSDSWTSTEVLNEVSFSGSATGRVRAILTRVRGGERTRLRTTSGRLQQFIGSDPASGRSFAFQLLPGEIDSGDTLLIEYRFPGVSRTLREGDEIFMIGHAASGEINGAPRHEQAIARFKEKFTRTFDVASVYRQSVYGLAAGTPLADVEIELETSIPRFSDAELVESLPYTFGAFLASASAEGPRGHLRIVVSRYPAAGGPRQILLKRAFGRNEQPFAFEEIPLPKGLAGGDRIVTHVFFNSDYVVPDSEFTNLITAAEIFPVGDLSGPLTQSGTLPGVR
ncbi:MAG: hypothetical protein GKS06_03085 [Acidobacteria bacterium]|nr:hypothetical protein [Acidobacteriota bacterium]